MRIRALALAIVLVILAGMIEPMDAQAVGYENTYVNTGNQRLDIIGVALTQLGYEEGAENASKYGSWIGLPNTAWCASFVSWCAVQADIPEDVLKKAYWVSEGPESFNIKIYKNNYTPRPGDLFYKNDFSHVGLVLSVEGDTFRTIEGNSDVLGSEEGRYVISNERLLADCYFGVPAYKGEGDHQYVKRSEQTHPHREYYECADCGDKHYTGKNTFETDCSKCMSCSCSTSYAGYYICDQDITVLNVRSGPGTNHQKIAGVHPGDVVYVYAADGSWAHIEYDGIYGYVFMEYITPYTPPATPEPQPPESTPPESEPTEAPTEEPHEHSYGEGINKHYHECTCGELYEAEEGNCSICGSVEEERVSGFPWWILCLLEAVVIVFLLIRSKLRKKKKRKAKYLH